MAEAEMAEAEMAEAEMVEVRPGGSVRRSIMNQNARGESRRANVTRADLATPRNAYRAAKS
jgi:hypothetical protein